MNLISAGQKKFHDFNHKNMALIGAVFVVLAVFMITQGTLFSSVSKLGFSLGKYVSVFASGPSSSQGAVLGASTLSPDIESQMNAVPITIAYQDTVGSAQTYIAQVQAVTTADSGNPDKLAQDLLPIAVPQTLQEYQQLIVVRAQLQAQLQAASADQQLQIQANVNAITQAIQAIQSNFVSQNVNLPS
jgi:hypothetical protein